MKRNTIAAFIVLVVLIVCYFVWRALPWSAEPTVRVTLEEALAGIRGQTPTERTQKPSAIPVVDYPDVTFSIAAEEDEVKIWGQNALIAEYAPKRFSVGGDGRVTKLMFQFKSELASEHTLEGFRENYIGGDLMLSLRDGTSWHDTENTKFTSYENGVLSGEMSGKLDTVHVGGCGMIQDASCYNYFYTGDSEYRVTFSLPIP